MNEINFEDKNNTYVLLWRSLLQKHYDPETLAIWVTLLLSAAYAHTVWRNVKLQPGQLLTGRQKLAETSGIDENKIERILKKLEIEQQIEQQKTTKYRIITIKNWGRYQKVNNKLNNKIQQNTTKNTFNNNNNNNNNNKENIVPAPRALPPHAEFVKNWGELYEARTGQPYLAGAAEYSLAASLFKKFPAAVVVEKTKLLYELCETGGAWFAKSLADYTIKKLSSHWNEIIEEVKTKKQKTTAEIIDGWKPREEKINEKRYAQIRDQEAGV